MSSNNSSNNSNSGIYRQSNDECDEESRDERDDVDVLRVKAEGWSVLADSQVKIKCKRKIIPSIDLHFALIFNFNSWFVNCF